MIPRLRLVRRLLPPLAAALLAAAAAPEAGVAQVSAADSASVLLEAAEGFDADGRSNVARALYELILERFPGTPAGAIAAERVRGIAARGTEGSGNVELQIWTTLYGLWLGVAVPAALGVDDGAPYGVGLLAGGPAGFFGGRAIAGSRDLTEGQARAITLGGLWGGWQAFGWREVFDWGVGEVCQTDGGGTTYCYADEGSSEEAFAAMIVGSIAGMVVGNGLSDRPISPGTATTVNFGALWGTWFGVAAGVLLDLEDDDLLAATLVGGDAGLVGTMAVAPRLGWSRNRARLVSIAGVIGALGGAGIDLIADVNDEKTGVAIPLATSIAGLSLGVLATRDYDAGRMPAPEDSEPPGGALLRFADGSWSLDAPVPYPVLLERPSARGPVLTTGLGITLFEVKLP